MSCGCSLTDSKSVIPLRAILGRIRKCHKNMYACCQAHMDIFLLKNQLRRLPLRAILGTILRCKKVFCTLSDLKSDSSKYSRTYVPREIQKKNTCRFFKISGSSIMTSGSSINSHKMPLVTAGSSMLVNH